MNKTQIYLTIKNLAKCQGFYSKVFSQLNDESLDFLEKQNFKDVIDLVVFLES